jgi:1-acyl-sn-glycerol-3-phosphate acyltransferase
MRVAMQIIEHIDKVFEKTKNSYSARFTAELAAVPYHTLFRRLAHALYQPYKWLIFCPFFIISTLVLFPLALISTLTFGPRFCSSVFPPVWSRINSWITPMRVKTYGKDLIDPNQSYVVVSNHQSLYDIFVIYGWLGLDIKWVMKTELRKVPIIGYICEKMEHIYIDRCNPRAAVESINRAKAKIVGGTSVIFFPEGTRSTTGRLGPFKKGAFRLAVDLGLPILPVTISGTRDILPKGSLDLFPGRVKMVVHSPIRTQGYNHSSLEPLMKKTRKQIASHLSH